MAEITVMLGQILKQIKAQTDCSHAYIHPTSNRKIQEGE